MSSSIPHVPNSARPALLSLVEEHLTGLIREAVMVQRHCKRARIHLPASNNDGDSPEDAATTTATATVSSGKEPAAKRRLHAEDINMALQWRGSEKIYATATVGNNSSDDKKILLEEYLKSELELRPPQEVGMTIHWLAVDGIQPDIPQNPPPLPGSSQADDSNEVHRVEPEDEAMDAQGSSSEGVQVTQLLPRLLSEELQLYFSRVTTAIERGGANPTTRQQQDAALASVAQDSGLQELVPFLVNYVSKALYRHVGSPDHCRTLVRMARALLHNPHLHLELHVSRRLFFMARRILLACIFPICLLTPRIACTHCYSYVLCNLLVTSIITSSFDVRGGGAPIVQTGRKSLDASPRSGNGLGASLQPVSAKSSDHRTNTGIAKHQFSLIFSLLSVLFFAQGLETIMPLSRPVSSEPYVTPQVPTGVCQLNTVALSRFRSLVRRRLTLFYCLSRYGIGKHGKLHWTRREIWGNDSSCKCASKRSWTPWESSYLTPMKVNCRGIIY